MAPTASGSAWSVKPTTIDQTALVAAPQRAVPRRVPGEKAGRVRKEAVVAATVVARNKRYEGLLVGGLAFFAGVSNVLCQSHYNCFANMMTGNVIWTMTALSRFDEHRLIKTKLNVTLSRSSFSLIDVITIKLKTTLRIASDMSSMTTKAPWFREDHLIMLKFAKFVDIDY